VHRFAYAKPLKQREDVIVAKMKYTHAGGLEFLESLESTRASKKVWGLQTGTFHKVKAITLSPNYWGERPVGHRHYFFLLDGCANDGTARGFFNEFLKEDLNAHRKVFEILGSKMIVPPSDRQLSGLGFSSTQRNSLICRVKGSFTRTIKVIF
jgi:hypothetical protein